MIIYRPEYDPDDDLVLDEADDLRAALTVADVSYQMAFCPDLLATGILAAWRENDATEAGRLLLNYLEAGIEKAARENVEKRLRKDEEDFAAAEGQARREWNIGRAA